MRPSSSLTVALQLRKPFCLDFRIISKFLLLTGTLCYLIWMNLRICGEYPFLVGQPAISQTPCSICCLLEWWTKLHPSDFCAPGAPNVFDHILRQIAQHPWSIQYSLDLGIFQQSVLRLTDVDGDWEIPSRKSGDESHVHGRRPEREASASTNDGTEPVNPHTATDLSASGTARFLCR